MDKLPGLRLVPEYRERVWGGHRLRPEGPPTGEAWIVYEKNRVASGPHEGKTLAELCERYGEALLGEQPVKLTGTRFPLLIKLLDCSAWLSVQVHPTDRQAEELEGRGQFGKTEAWHILEADPGARIISGVKPHTTEEELAEAIRAGRVLDHVNYLDVKAGETILTPAGTVHALGPGLLIYEVQQTSDITYRIFDWNRPQEAGRELHLEQSATVADPHSAPQPLPRPRLRDGEQRELVTCRYFALDLLAADRKRTDLDTRGRSFHAFTVIEGEVELEGEGWSERVGSFETVLVPAGCGRYSVSPYTPAQALLARVP